MASGGNLDPVTQCPLCEHPVHNSDELQVHYLTSCSGYDGKGNHEISLGTIINNHCLHTYSFS